MSSLYEFMMWSQTTEWIVIAIGLISAMTVFSYPASLKKKTTGLAVILALVLVWRFGLQPPGFGTGGDRNYYALGFINIQRRGLLSFELARDPLWSIIAYAISWLGDYKLYFIILAAFYVGIYFIVSYKLAGRRSYWLLAAIAVSFGFTGYAVNTMRAGLAVAFLCLSLCYRRKPIVMGALMAASAFTHLSMLLPITALVFSRYFDRTRLYIALWALAVPLSFAAGSFFNTHLADLVEDKRSSYLTNEFNLGYNIGFRINFIIYSLAPLAVGAYYIYRKKFKDRFYKMLFNGYILSNIVWILVIRASFSDRFAYLSWFLIPFILVYPLVQQKPAVRKPAMWLAAILVADTLFKLVV